MKLVILGVAAFVVILVLDRLFRSRGSHPGVRQGVSPVGSDVQSGTDADIERLVASGRKIEAIKLHRQLHRTGLKEAKDAVEALASRLPR